MEGVRQAEKDVTMHQMIGGLPLKLLLFFMTAVLTHLTVSFSQTVMHYALAHRPLGGSLFRNHVGFHHRYYSKDHLVSKKYLADEGNLTPFFLIPVLFIGLLSYLALPTSIFIVQAIACALSFYAHVFFDKEYHVEGSRLGRFSWFRKMQALHFVHHHHADRNFAVIDFFWDRLLGTYREPDPP
jgi:sterol desaturase/sphingolipid hydroxylase (fatty acid hydroxylase superfamily)